MKIPDKVVASSDPKTALEDATFVVHAVPVQYSRGFLEGVKEFIKEGTPVLSASKGIGEHSTKDSQLLLSIDR